MEFDRRAAIARSKPVAGLQRDRGCPDRSSNRSDMRANRWLVLSVPPRGLGALRKAPCGGCTALFKPESRMAVEFERLIRASSLIW
jgi:hypothetical protein